MKLYEIDSKVCNTIRKFPGIRASQLSVIFGFNIQHTRILKRLIDQGLVEEVLVKAGPHYIVRGVYDDKTKVLLSLLSSRSLHRISKLLLRGALPIREIAGRLDYVEYGVRLNLFLLESYGIVRKISVRPVLYEVTNDKLVKTLLNETAWLDFRD